MVPKAAGDETKRWVAGETRRSALRSCAQTAQGSWQPRGAWVVAKARHGYTFGMKTAISLPDGIFREAERLAKRLKKSRSVLYQEAVAEYLARHEPEAITEAMNELATQVDTRLDPFSSNAARRVLERSEW